MAHEAFRVLSSLHDTPLLISEGGLSTIISYLEHRNTSDFKMEEGDVQQKRVAFNPATGVGVVQISGPLTDKPTGMEMMCGGTSYQSVLEQTEEMLQAGASTLVLYADSGGGEAYGCFETANEIRAMADKAGARVISYVDGTAASACYGLVSVSDEIVVNPSASVGSVGVVVRLRNTMEAEAKEGVKTTFVYAGGEKIPFAADGSFREEFIARLQEDVDAMYSDFVAHVAKGRKLSKEEVKATEARMYRAEAAIEKGLADKVMTRSEFAQYLSNIDNERKNMSMLDKLLGKLKAEGDNAEAAELTAELESYKSQLSDINAQFAQMQEQFALAKQSLEANVADAVARAEAAEAALKQKEADEKAAAEAAEQARIAARKEKLAVAVGDEKAEEMFADLAMLSDEAYERVVQSLSVAVDAKDAQMAEVGFTVDGAKEGAEFTHFEKYLPKKKEGK